ncbi:MAG: MBL fold metallo-hydrolase [Xanthomonadales bacterium]|jgi:glyoxylase-like metal-dependent hydrolase (beta-lactamase superfamily II)|nr:MBL fold metallo-hydrolase [Xanthomonadales bacterium]
MPHNSSPLSYPLGAAPELGLALDVAPGVKWLRLPLPFQLNHINVWLLRDGDGWALVDTGLFTNTTREIWHQVLEQHLEGAPLTRVLVTHLHPDHAGCAGWLARKFGVELWMSRDEYLLCRVLVADTGKPAPPEGLRFYRDAGFEAEALDRYAEYFGAFGRVVSPLPEAYRRLRDGMTVQIGEHSWEVVVGRGHSPEHACLLCRELNIMIAGDQVLPTISSNVSVYPTEPSANPLLFWFESLEKLRQALPPEVLVLPAHGKPFLGVQARLAQLTAEHEEGLAKLRTLCREPRRAVDVFPALFKSPISEKNLIMATGEAISHLNYLVERNEMTVRPDAAGVKWYRLCQ